MLKILNTFTKMLGYKVTPNNLEDTTMVSNLEESNTNLVESEKMLHSKFLDLTLKVSELQCELNKSEDTVDRMTMERATIRKTIAEQCTKIEDLTLKLSNIDESNDQINESLVK